MAAMDMVGQRFGSLLAVRIAGRAASGDLKWLFLCECGAEFAANGYYVRCGKVTSCPGCSAQRSRAASVVHGKSGTREFAIWTGMHTRCYNPRAKSYADYGGRGIRICRRWRESFPCFFEDMGPSPSSGHSIERRNNSGDYEPGNCYWATNTEQANNKRNTILVTIEGRTQSMTAWARHFGVHVSTASLRHKQGLRGMAIFQTTKRQVTHNGVTDTVAGWSSRTGIKASTIAMRIDRYHWPIERALTQGATN